MYRSYNDGKTTDTPGPMHSPVKATQNPEESIYGVALIAAIGAAITMAIFGFAFGWYTYVLDHYYRQTQP